MCVAAMKNPVAILNTGISPCLLLPFVCVYSPLMIPLINASQLVLDFPEGRGLERMECYLLTTVLTPSEGCD